jgi:hypothetical protein
LDIFCGPLAYQPRRPDAEILAEYLDLWERLYDRGTFLARTHRCCLAMRPTREAQAAQAGSRGTAPKPRSAMEGKTSRHHVRDVKQMLRLSWDYGVKPSCRRQFWRVLIDIRRRNPSRQIRFLSYCFLGNAMIYLKGVVRERLQKFI